LPDGVVIIIDQSTWVIGMFELASVKFILIVVRSEVLGCVGFTPNARFIPSKLTCCGSLSVVDAAVLLSSRTVCADVNTG
jgi:hypothetical protein